jgi:hypothetical protein
MMHVGNDTTEESSWAIKRTKKVHGVMEYIEKWFQKYFVPGNTFCFFHFMPFLRQIFEQNSLLSGFVGI